MTGITDWTITLVEYFTFPLSKGMNVNELVEWIDSHCNNLCKQQFHTNGYSHDMNSQQKKEWMYSCLDDLESAGLIQHDET